MPEGEDIFYYLTLYNENYAMPPMPEGVEEGILKGLYKFKAGAREAAAQGPHPRQRADHPRGAAGAGNPGARSYDVSADVWSATSYKLLRNDALRAKRWNMLHPTEPPQKSYVETVLEKRARACSSPSPTT